MFNGELKRKIRLQDIEIQTLKEQFEALQSKGKKGKKSVDNGCGHWELKINMIGDSNDLSHIGLSETKVKKLVQDVAAQLNGKREFILLKEQGIVFRKNQIVMVWAKEDC